MERRAFWGSNDGARDELTVVACFPLCMVCLAVTALWMARGEAARRLQHCHNRSRYNKRQSLFFSNTVETATGQSPRPGRPSAVPAAAAEIAPSNASSPPSRRTPFRCNSTSLPRGITWPRTTRVSTTTSMRLRGWNRCVALGARAIRFAAGMRASISTTRTGGGERWTSSFRRAPRSVAIQYAREGGIISARSLDYDNGSEGTPARFEEDSMPAKGPRVRPSWFEPNAADFVDGVDDEVCVPMYDWQLASYPSCNRFHKLDMRALRVINTGGSRIAFELREDLPNNTRGRYVYKTVKYRKEVTARLVEEQRKDAIVLERTSSSNFIPDIHGYCSLGVMMDFMPEGNMHDYIKGARLAGGSMLGPVDRLRLSM